MCSFADFLETCPPGADRVVQNATNLDYRDNRLLKLPQLHSHCTHARCNGLRFWSTSETKYVKEAEVGFHFVMYTCRNCTETKKLFALIVTPQKEKPENARIIKLGELPAFGPPTPSRLIAMIGPDRDIFLKGRRCENQGLGVGAFAYYRRVVENQKSRIIDEMIRVSEDLGAAEPIIADLRTARDETQFSRSVDAIKHGIPDSLKVKGSNPLALLHSALSEGLHSHDDETCLELAQSIRIVLAELAERIGQSLKDDAELAAAVNRLTQKKAAKAE
jgi:hypothetical protein